MIDYTLLPHQKVGVKYMLAHNYCINSMTQWVLGKSLQALEVAKRTKLPTAVLCPSFLKGTWIGEIEKFTDRLKEYL